MSFLTSSVYGLINMLLGFFYPPRLYRAFSVPDEDEPVGRLVGVLLLVAVVVIGGWWGFGHLLVDEAGVVFWEVTGPVILLGSYLAGMAVFFRGFCGRWAEPADLLLIVLIPVYWLGFGFLLQSLISASSLEYSVFVGAIQLVILLGYALWHLGSLYSIRGEVSVNASVWIGLLILFLPGWLLWLPFPRGHDGLFFFLTTQWDSVIPWFVLALVGYLLFGFTLTDWLDQENYLDINEVSEWASVGLVWLMMPGLVGIFFVVGWNSLNRLVTEPADLTDSSGVVMTEEDRTQLKRILDLKDQFDRQDLFDQQAEELTDTGVRQGDQMVSRLETITEDVPITVPSGKGYEEGELKDQFLKNILGYVGLARYYRALAQREFDRGARDEALRILEESHRFSQQLLHGQTPLMGKLTAHANEGIALDGMKRIVSRQLTDSKRERLLAFLRQEWKPVEAENYWPKEMFGPPTRVQGNGFSGIPTVLGYLLTGLKPTEIVGQLNHWHHETLTRAHRKYLAGEPGSVWPPPEINLIHMAFNRPHTYLFELIIRPSASPQIRDSFQDIESGRRQHLCLIAGLRDQIGGEPKKLEIDRYEWPDPGCMDDQELWE